MADDLRTAADLLKVNDLALDENLKNDLRQGAPFLAALQAVTATNGTIHKYLKRTGAPTVGFRAINAGRELDKSEQTVVQVDLKYLDADFALDVAYCQAFDSPVYGSGTNAAINSELGEHLAAMMFAYEQQLINGTGNDANGFDGLADSLSALSGALVTSAGGATATSQTSCYLVRTGPNDCRAVIGQEGNMTLNEPYQTRMSDGTNTFSAWSTCLGGWMGMEIGSIWSAGRIANIEDTFTDDEVFGLASLFPANRQPNLCVMSPKALELLRKSRTATNPTGAPAPWADMVLQNVPVIVTDAIATNEAVVA